MSNEKKAQQGEFDIEEEMPEFPEPDRAPARLKRIQVFTRHGVIEGELGSGSKVRTLDELNVLVPNFLLINSPAMVSSSPWPLESLRWAIGKSDILFVVELYSESRPASHVFDGESFTRANLRLLVGEYCIEGYLYIPPGGDPMRRLNQHDHPFFALTAAQVKGSGRSFASAFLAINMAHVAAAEVIPARASRADKNAGEDGP